MNDLTQMQQVNAAGVVWSRRRIMDRALLKLMAGYDDSPYRYVQVGVSTILFAGVAHAAEPCKTVSYLVGVSLNDPASNIPG